MKGVDRLVVMRHSARADRDGEPFDRSRAWDPPLSSRGAALADAQGAALADFMRARGGVGAVVTSPFTRTMQTARAVLRAAGLGKAALAVHKGLAEAFNWHNVLRHARVGRWVRAAEDWLFPPGFFDRFRAAGVRVAGVLPAGYETPAATAARVAAAADDVARTAEGPSAVLVTHEAGVKALLHRLAGVRVGSVPLAGWFVLRRRAPAGGGAWELEGRG